MRIRKWGVEILSSGSGNLTGVVDIILGEGDKGMRGVDSAPSAATWEYIFPGSNRGISGFLSIKMSRNVIRGKADPLKSSNSGAIKGLPSRITFPSGTCIISKCDNRRVKSVS